jgi:hypothetical protein
MQPARHPGAHPAQTPVPPGPHLQHRDVIISPCLPPGSPAQRRDRNRNRPGVVRVILAHVTGGQQPDPRTQPGPHIQHQPTGRQQLLGQQAAHAAGAPDRPGSAPARPPPSPAAVPPGHLTHTPASSPSAATATPIATAACEASYGSIPIITAAMTSPSPVPGLTVAGMPNSRTPAVALAPLLSHATGAAPASWHVIRKPRHTWPAGGERACAPGSQRYDPDSLPSRPGPHRLQPILN